MKVALVHDWLTNMGGAERVIINLKEIYKEAPIYTSLYNPDKLDDELRNIDVRTSFLQKPKNIKRGHQKLLPFMPMAFESFDLNEYDIVLSSCSSCAKGVVTNPNTMHVCYCHTPMRYAWEYYYEYADEWGLNKLKGKLLKYVMNYIRLWDGVSSKRVDYYIANSQNVAKRIWKHYKRESVVIHPPVRCKLFDISDVNEEYFLIVSRLVPYKRIDLAVEVFNELGLPLVVIGGGKDLDRLKNMAKDNIKFLGRQSDEVIKEYYSKCRAFIFPGEEDFGITPLEAQASGRPVIAYGKGGALETVVSGVTGVFFKEQTVDSLKSAVNEFEKINFDKSVIRRHAEEFDEEIFKKKIREYLSRSYDEFKKLKKWKVI
ncbi:glycosyltransferase involved in cell wall biosynthesis [Clostridium acetobutylicum]|uniref:Glycosyltransferase n=1 Tax=Clostridium acetobutylicum (strain ATCC 824 / DSM 792 / JCM 1419 / IAM 19013 / LMG 5710 / NBRC 13948 / NRRL B-527 / VKM B-1787 / 2291 / W) TaxID=272562 RepID=Q97EN7_CLOAB|nr:MULTISPECIES: glycosyltransferase family 4 protein [Clostridium]AAK81011.1 Glycosyltransferase [Clostridium acetobutylicum ATCC 824]ADZ22114.1 Glycosyltransferase [Clostridium acetobutylicum EA 2018]AEI32675.1 glycosyltransferase [Clostridium acetobutylicum DSM 1731]AWV78578.1 glycosyltransferase family 4 protein [Clostridium acetobutylicum]MBC2393438.1 glycosyltransferase family 4 protein [Clostridium acetobutylicum]